MARTLAVFSSETLFPARALRLSTMPSPSERLERMTAFLFWDGLDYFSAAEQAGRREARAMAVRESGMTYLLLDMFLPPEYT